MIPGERVVSVLVVDVEPEHVGRDPALAEVLRDEADLRLRVVAVAALLVAEGPPRRQRHPAGQLRVARDDLLRRGAVDEVVVQLAPRGAEGEEILALAADVERGAERVVEEEAVGPPRPHHDEEGDRDVDGIGVLAVGVGVAVPHHVAVAAEVASPLVEPPRLFPEAVEVLVVA